MFPNINLEKYKKFTPINHGFPEILSVMISWIMDYQNNIFTTFVNQTGSVDYIVNNPHSLAFFDKFPKAKVHILVIPKGLYVDMADFLMKASPEEQLDLNLTIKQIIEQFQLNQKGFNIKINNKKSHGQEIFHYHVHITSDQ
jgi:diadenosine tetraphosphate (Ap4A) HIT family hydrolase